MIYRQLWCFCYFLLGTATTAGTAGFLSSQIFSLAVSEFFLAVEITCGSCGDCGGD
jgi:hypothetical protein